MKELDTLIKTVADGLKSMAQGVEKLAEKVESIRKSLPDETTKTKAGARTKRKASTAAVKKPAKKTAKKAAAEKDKPMTAADTVLNIIKRSRKGVDTNTLMQKTGYDRKKVANIIYKLKKLDQIKSTGKGMYSKI